MRHTVTRYGQTAPLVVNANAADREFDATDRQIDQLVYELYGLTDDEIRLVEEAAHR